MWWAINVAFEVAQAPNVSATVADVLPRLLGRRRALDTQHLVMVCHLALSLCVHSVPSRRDRYRATARTAAMLFE